MLLLLGLTTHYCSSWLCHTNGQMYIYMIASSIKILTSAVFCHLLIQVIQHGFMLRLIHVFLGCDLWIQLLLKLLSSTYDNRLVDQFHQIPIHITNYKYVLLYAWTNRPTHFSTCNLPIWLLLGVNIVNKCLITRVILY